MRFRYKDEAIAYKEEHLKDRQQPQCYVQYMIAIINNCQTFKYVPLLVFVRVWGLGTLSSYPSSRRLGFHIFLLFRESINSLKRKYSQSTETNHNDATIEKTLNEVAKEGCQFLLDEVFLDLEVRRTAVSFSHYFGL